MQSFNKTKYRFAHAMLEVMKKEPLDKITVKDIVKEADMTRQTFYRNFQDKYDLVNWYFDVLAQKSFKQIGDKLYVKGRINQKSFPLLKKNVCFSQRLFCTIIKTRCLTMIMNVFYSFIRILLRKNFNVL